MSAPLDRAGLWRAAAGNYAEALELLARHHGDPRAGRRRFGRVEAMPVGHEVPFYNAVVALDPGASEADILAAVGWVETRGLIPSVHIAVGTASAADLERHGLRRAVYATMGFGEIGSVAIFTRADDAPASPAATR